MPRWITVRQSFDYHWPDRSALTHFSEADCGDHLVKDELADFAVEKGYATEGKLSAGSRSRKGGKKRVAAKPRKKDSATGPTTDMRGGLRVGDADVSADDRSADRAAVDHDAS